MSTSINQRKRLRKKALPFVIFGLFVAISAGIIAFVAKKYEVKKYTQAAYYHELSVDSLYRHTAKWQKELPEEITIPWDACIAVSDSAYRRSEIPTAEAKFWGLYVGVKLAGKKKSPVMVEFILPGFLRPSGTLTLKKVSGNRYKLVTWD